MSVACPQCGDEMRLLDVMSSEAAGDVIRQVYYCDSCCMYEDEMDWGPEEDENWLPVDREDNDIPF